MIETWIVPAQRLRLIGRDKEAGVLLVRYLVSSQPEGIYPDTVHWLFVIAPDCAAHPEPALRDAHHRRFDDCGPGRWGGSHSVQVRRDEAGAIEQGAVQNVS